MGREKRTIETTTLRVGVVVDSSSDTEEVDELTRRLRRQIMELDVVDVRSVEAVAPAGAKAGGVAAVGVLLVTLLKSAGGIHAVVRSARAWLSHHPGRMIELEIDGDRIKVTGATSLAQDRLIDAWIERHASPTETA